MPQRKDESITNSLVTRKTVAMAALGVTLGSQVHALGLGEFRVMSALDEPLVAEIRLTSVPPETLDSLNISLGNRSDFLRAGIDLSDPVQQLEFNIVDNLGAPVIRVTTQQPFKEPYLHFLVSAEWLDGSLTKEYTALVDPVLYDPVYNVATSSPGPTDTGASVPGVALDPGARTQPTDSTSSAGTSGLTGSRPVSAPQTPSPLFSFKNGVAQYGPTRPGDTLWNVGINFRSSGEGLNLFQIMLALFHENPQAFGNNNIHNLKVGKILGLSDIGSTAQIPLETASLMFQSHLEEWQYSAPLSDTEYPAATSANVVTPADSSSIADTSTNSVVGGGLSEKVISNLSSTDMEPKANISVTPVLEYKGLVDRVDSLASQVEINTQRLVEIQKSLAAMRQPGIDTVVQQPLNQGLSQGSLGITESPDISESMKDAATESMAADVNDGQITAAQTTQDSAQDPGAESQPSIASTTVDSSATGAAEATLDQPTTTEDANIVDDSTAKEPATGDLATRDDTPLSTQSSGDQVDLGSTSDTVEPDTASDVPGTSQLELDRQAEDAEITSIVKALTGDSVSSAEAGDEPDEAATSTPDSVEESDTWAGGVTKKFIGFGNLVMNNLTWFAGGLLALCALIVGLFVLRRKRSDEEIAQVFIDDNDDDQYLSGSSFEALPEQQEASSIEPPLRSGTFTSTLEDFSSPGIVSDEAYRPDALAEADLYLAYDNEEQAERVLLEAAAENPERLELKHRLLDIYRARNDLRAFEATAKELYRSIGPNDGPMWNQVVTMARELGIDDPLFNRNDADVVNVDTEEPDTEDSLLEPFLEPEAIADLDRTFEVEEESVDAGSAANDAQNEKKPSMESLDLQSILLNSDPYAESNDVDLLHEQVSSLEKALATRDHENDQLQQELVTLQEQAEHINSHESEELHNQIKSLEESLEVRVQENQELRERVAQLENRVEEILSQLSALQTDGSEEVPNPKVRKLR